ncbi:MAG: adenylate/guanylate cyclase domain-containing protein [Leptospiraceae bacterium]|nr:adenylate/guanylate cyclase domain-containing protein [Leptospiraceae bacterium]MCB1168763.1 adenylate/guanylate cyclase domain-containing protein [Leptospiraceae bacterium]
MSLIHFLKSRHVATAAASESDRNSELAARLCWCRLRDLHKALLLAAICLTFLPAVLHADQGLRKEALLDLREADWERIQSLDGQWAFYWNRLVPPLDLRSIPGSQEIPEKPDALVSVPDDWNGVEIAGQSIGGQGFATYYIKVLLSDQHPPLSLKFLDESSSYVVYVNGKLYGENGHVARCEDRYRPSYETKIFELQEPGTELDIVIHVANFDHRKGGLWESIRIGSQERIRQYREGRILFESFIAGTLVIMGFYHLGLFYLRRKDRSTLWFGLFCLIIVLRLVLLGERLLHDLSPEGWWSPLLRLEYLSVYGGLTTFLAFVHGLYPGETSRRFLLGVAIVSGFFAVFALFFPTDWYTHSVDYFQFVLLASILYVCVVFFLAIYRRREGAVFVTVASLVLSATVVNDLAYNQQVIQTAQLVGVGLFVFIFIQAFILSIRFSRAFSTIESMKDNLQQYNQAYSRFVPEEFLRYLHKDSILDIQLGDQVQETMSVLFLDIRDFTQRSEKMSPEQTFAFINDYLGRVGPLIRDHRGFIDKYLGDGLMALFPGQPEDAVQAGMAIQGAVQTFNLELQEMGLPPIRIGIGIHTGLLMLGTVGESERMDGTVISDAVNLAARTEGLTRIYGVTMIVSQDTLFHLKDPTAYNYRFLGKVRVKGKDQPVSIFEFFDCDEKETRTIKVVTREDFERGVMQLHSREFQQARASFEAVKRAAPDDRAADYYLSRLKNLEVRKDLALEGQ